MRRGGAAALCDEDEDEDCACAPAARERMQCAPLVKVRRARVLPGARGVHANECA
jgi:hypothetical protein